MSQQRNKTTKLKKTIMETTNNHTAEDQKYIVARLLMMQCERIGKEMSLERALELTDY